MKLPQNLARVTAEAGARHIALAHLKDVADGYLRLAGDGRAGDPEALHDFRVALRRLRSCLRAYRAELRTTVSKRSYARLRRLAHATRESRDLEVHLAWVQQGMADLPDHVRAGAGSVADDLAGRMQEADRQMLARLRAQFARGRRRLRRQLERLVLERSLEEGQRAHTMAAVTGRLVLERAAAVRASLASIHHLDDRDAIHAARIGAKQIRYLLEPFGDVPGARELLERLTAFQDTFGDLHDAQVFGDDLDDALGELLVSDPRRAGVVALRRRLDLRGRQAFAAARTRWLEGRSAEFFARVTDVAGALAALSHDDLELERKYLLRALPRFDPRPEVEEIEQGYLPGERVVERLRRVRVDGTEHYVRTVKSGSGLSRIELEEGMEAEMFELLWPLTHGRRLRKRRYRVREGNHTWEVDEYLDRELFVAEVDLVSAEEVVKLPVWLRPVVLREITEDASYSNRELAH